MTVDFDSWVSITETKARYCRCLDTKDWKGFSDCFETNAIADMRAIGGPTIAGRAAIVTSVSQSMEGAISVHVHSPEIAIHDDTADVIWAL